MSSRSPSADLLMLIVRANEFISNSELDQISDVDLISLETRLLQWHSTVASELAWRHQQRAVAQIDAARRTA